MISNFSNQHRCTAASGALGYALRGGFLHRKAEVASLANYECGGGRGGGGKSRPMEHRPK